MPSTTSTREPLATNLSQHRRDEKCTTATLNGNVLARTMPFNNAVNGEWRFTVTKIHVICFLSLLFALAESCRRNRIKFTLNLAKFLFCQTQAKNFARGGFRSLERDWEKWLIYFSEKSGIFAENDWKKITKIAWLRRIFKLDFAQAFH